MAANIQITSDKDMHSIITAAGGNIDDKSSYWYQEGKLYVKGVTQDALNLALVNYDPMAAERTSAKAQIGATDKDMARVSEDLINILVSKNIITLSELPLTTQEKINKRKALRNKI